MKREGAARHKTVYSGSVTDTWRALLRKSRFHALPLAIVLAVSLGSQALVLLRGGWPATFPDTNGYIVAARTLLAGSLTPNPFRTPGYPLFLAEIFWLAGGENLRYVVIAQATLLVIGALEIYALIFILTRRRWIGALIASLVGGNIYLANWSRPILSEALTTWLIISVMLCFAVYLRRTSREALALLVLLVIAAVFTRPQLVYLPAILLAVLVARALRRRRTIGWIRALLRLWPAATGLMGVYALVLLYMLAFLNTYGAFTTTVVSNINLLGMSMKFHTIYHMPYTGAEPQYDQLRADLESYPGDDVFGFITTHRQYGEHEGQFYGAFASEVLRAHPGYVLRGAYDAFMLTTSWNQPPNYPVRVTAAPAWLLYLSQDIGLVYACMPLLLIASVVAAWRNPDSTPAVMLATLMLVIVVHVGTGAVADFAAFDRLRMPVDWAMLSVTALAIIQIFSGAQAKAAPFASLAATPFASAATVLPPSVATVLATVPLTSSTADPSTGLAGEAPAQTPTLKTRATPAMNSERSEG